jgi:hypothetical protein
VQYVLGRKPPTVAAAAEPSAAAIAAVPTEGDDTA